MNLKFISKYNGNDLRPCSFWCEPIRYNFEITYDDSYEDIELLKKEFKLNCRNQLTSP